MKKLLNPRGYLSWTQIDMWLRSPERYVRQYMHGEADVSTDRMAFGSRVGRALETGEESGDAIVDMLAAILPRYKVMEHEIKTTFKGKGGSFVLLGKLDTFETLGINRNFMVRFREYKTGTQKWTQHRADNHRQLDHYAALCWLEYGRLPTSIHLDWAQTERDSLGDIRLTGHHQTFEVKKILPDVLQYLALASRVAKEIDARYRLELKNAS